jgi:hypothetical protein
MKSFLYLYNVNNYDPKMEEIGETIFEVWFIDNDYRQNTIDDQIQTVNKPLKILHTTFVTSVANMWILDERRPTHEKRKGDEVLCMTKLDALRIHVYICADFK